PILRNSAFFESNRRPSSNVRHSGFIVWAFRCNDQNVIDSLLLSQIGAEVGVGPALSRRTQHCLRSECVQIRVTEFDIERDFAWHGLPTRRHALGTGVRLSAVEPSPKRRFRERSPMSESEVVDAEPVTATQAQSFGDDPLQVRDTGHYTDEYVSEFVEKWDDLIDWRRRYESEGRFFVDLLKSRGVRSVLDVATGTGFHSVRLLEE